MSKGYWSAFNRLELEFEMPREAVEDCSHQGSCDEDVEHWQKVLKLDLPRKPMIRELLEYGAWEVRELCALGNDELEQKLIWLAAGNIKDEEAYQEDEGDDDDE